jgi:DNA repair ATPase RecN
MSSLINQINAMVNQINDHDDITTAMKNEIKELKMENAEYVIALNKAKNPGLYGSRLTNVEEAVESLTQFITDSDSNVSSIDTRLEALENSSIETRLEALEKKTNSVTNDVRRTKCPVYEPTAGPHFIS